MIVKLNYITCDGADEFIHFYFSNDNQMRVVQLLSKDIYNEIFDYLSSHGVKYDHDYKCFVVEQSDFLKLVIDSNRFYIIELHSNYLKLDAKQHSSTIIMLKHLGYFNRFNIIAKRISHDSTLYFLKYSKDAKDLIKIMRPQYIECHNNKEK